jgi:YegS/Rv2252/BmrU family lipid kinase
MAGLFKRIHVIINPASGKDQPILNILNDVCKEHGVDWDISITKKYGDAQQQARDAIGRGVDLVVGYGGDGTQHEVANAVIGTGMTMGVLPGGTGNGFAHELGLSNDVRAAVEVLCTSNKLRKIDVGKVGDDYFIQRLYAGIEPEKQTSRQDKDKYGIFAYTVTLKSQVFGEAESAFRLRIDDEVLDLTGFKCYIVNSAKTGSRFSLAGQFKVDDGLLDVFVVSKRNWLTLRAARDRMLHLPTPAANYYCWHGREITIEAEPDKAVWMDGEVYGRTPVTATVVPSALQVVVP